MPSDERGARTVGVSDMPRTIKGYQWFDQIAGRKITVEGVSLLGHNKGATRYAACVVCGSREQAKDFVKRVKERNDGPRARVLNDDREVEKFREEMAKSKGWSSDAPDGDKAITPSSGADIRGDATGFKHGFNPYKRSDGDRRSRSRGRRSPSRKRRLSRSPSRSPPRRDRDQRDRGHSRSRSGSQ